MERNVQQVNHETLSEELSLILREIENKPVPGHLLELALELQNRLTLQHQITASSLPGGAFRRVSS